jgi:hypothetical protein
MPRATADNTTPTSAMAAKAAIPSRRRLLAGLSATLLAGAAIATAARGAPVADAPADGADAKLIRLCERMVAIHTAEVALVDADEWAPDRGPNKPRYDALWAEWIAIRDRVYDLNDPTTVAGAAALSRVALTVVDRDFEGNPKPRCFFEWLALGVLEFQAGSAVA